MFSGFTDSTVTFFMDLRFHNNTAFFRDNHELYLENVQAPFYTFIQDLGPEMLKIDPLMETRPYKCMSHIHRDTRFSKDKSPYRDHAWFLFRRAAEPREKSLNYFFEFGPSQLGWGMGFWGENREVMDIFRKKMIACPEAIRELISDCLIPEHHLAIEGSSIHKRMTVPENIPPDLQTWYRLKEVYICKENPSYRLAFSEQLYQTVLNDFQTLAPLYRYWRGIADEL